MAGRKGRRGPGARVLWPGPRVVGGTFRTELHDVVANDEHAVALFTARADRTDRRLEDRIVEVFASVGQACSQGSRAAAWSSCIPGCPDLLLANPLARSAREWRRGPCFVRSWTRCQEWAAATSAQARNWSLARLPGKGPRTERIHARHLLAPAVVRVRRPSPIGLTAADLFAGGEVSRADSRVRSPGTFTCARCPAGTSALDAVPEAYHNPAAVWWGAFALSRAIRD